MFTGRLKRCHGARFKCQRWSCNITEAELHLMLGRQYCRIASRSGVDTVVPADTGGLLDTRPGSQRNFSEPLVGNMQTPALPCAWHRVPVVGQGTMRGRQDLDCFEISGIEGYKRFCLRFSVVFDLIPVPGHTTSVPIYLRGSQGCLHSEAGRVRHRRYT